MATSGGDAAAPLQNGLVDDGAARGPNASDTSSEFIPISGSTLYFGVLIGESETRAIVDFTYYAPYPRVNDGTC